MPASLPPQTRAAIERRALNGENLSKVSRDLKISRTSVRKYWPLKTALDTELATSLDPSPEPVVTPGWSRTPEDFKRFYIKFSGMYFPSHWQEWVKDYFENTRLLINVPPRHGKSKLFSVWLPLFEACLNPDVQILLISQANHLAKKWALEIAWHMEQNKDLIAEFGPFRSDESTFVWRPQSGELMHAKRRRAITMGDVTFQIKGRTQQILGSEADIIVVDDITDRDISQSETERLKLANAFRGEIMTRRTPNGKVVVVGQRVHALDLYGELAEQRLTKVQGQPRLWRHINYPAVNWETQEVLWPEEWPFTRLMETYEELSSKGSTALFETMYQQNPVMDDAAMLDRVWIEGDATHPGCWDLRAWGEPPGPLKDQDVGWWTRTRVISVDPSPTRYTGVVIADVDTHKDEAGSAYRIHVIEASSHRWNLRDIVSNLRGAVAKYGPIDYVIFEQNAAQRWFLQDIEFRQIRDAYQFRVRGHTTTHQNKADDQFGVQSLGAAFENGLIRLPGGSPTDRRKIEPLIEEGLQFPWGSTDDILMALWFIRWQSQRLYPQIRDGETTAMPLGPGNPGTYGWTNYDWRNYGRSTRKPSSP